MNPDETVSEEEDYKNMYDIATLIVSHKSKRSLEKRVEEEKDEKERVQEVTRQILSYLNQSKISLIEEDRQQQETEEMAHRNYSISALKIPYNSFESLKEEIYNRYQGEYPVYFLKGLYREDVSEFEINGFEDFQVVDMSFLFQDVSFCDISKYHATIMVLNIAANLHKLLNCNPHMIQILDFPPSLYEQRAFCKQRVLGYTIR